MEKESRVATLTDLQWDIVDMLLDGSGQPIRDYVALDGIEQTIIRAEEDDQRQIIAFFLSPAGDVRSYSARPYNRALEYIGVDEDIGNDLGVDLFTHINLQYEFGLVVPVGDELDPFKRLLMSFINEQ